MKLITFNADGTMETENLINPVFLPITSTIQAKDLPKQEKNVAKNRQKESPLVSSIFSGLNLKGRNKRLKIYRKCNKEMTICRFLFCPDLRISCRMCQVSIRDTTNSTIHCEIFSTSFLI